MAEIAPMTVPAFRAAKAAGKKMSTLRKVWQAFVPHFLQKREGYQRRVGGFLLERLHGFLLLDHVTSLPVERTTVGRLVIVSESEVVQPTV